MPKTSITERTNCQDMNSKQAGRFGKCEGCPNQQVCSSSDKNFSGNQEQILQRMSLIKHKLLVLSGKGGVGKSTLSAHLALELASRGLEVGLLDIDICGPSIPKMMGLEGHKIHQDSFGWSPVFCSENLSVMSIGFLLAESNNAIIWRGVKKNALIKQFIRDVNWGALDYLIIDTPPGTSDEHISIVQSLRLPGHCALGALIVTTPQEMSLQDVRKEINFCKKLEVPIVGIVENMSFLIADISSYSFATADMNATNLIDITSEAQEILFRHFPGRQLSISTNVFHHSLVEPTSTMALSLGIPFLGFIPFDKLLGMACEEGKSLQELLSFQGINAKTYDLRNKIRAIVNEIRKFWNDIKALNL